MGFYGGAFTFDEKRGEDMFGAFMLGSSEEGRNVGYSFDLKKEDNSYFGVVPKSITIPIKITFKDKNGNTKKLKTEERRSFLEWIYPMDKNYKELYLEESKLYYFVKFQDLKWQEYSQADVLTGNVITLDGYCYSPIIRYDSMVKDNREAYLEIDNFSNVDNYYYPEIFIGVGDNTGIVEIENITTQKTMKLNMKENESVKINCEREIIKSNLMTHKYNDFSGNYLSLAYGNNKIKIKGISSRVVIICRFPMLME